MSNEQAMRDLLGMVLAWHRGDNDAYRTLRPSGDEKDPRAFHVTAFGTITSLADEVANLVGTGPKEVLEHLRSQGEGSRMATVADVVLAGLAADADRFNVTGQQASREADFIPAIFQTLIWLAEQIAIAKGGTADDVLQEYAMTAAMGEAGMLDDDG